ncbi:MAG: 1,4-dihydroxy-2-naphthoate polyprenyltransferase [archaeon]
MSNRFDPNDPTRREAWLMAARPQTLPAAIAPILVGAGLAVHDDVFDPTTALAALVGAVLIQIGTNFANDYYDAVKGTDSADREGFTRVTAGGLIEPAAVKRAMVLTFLTAILVGAYLVAIGGVPILVVGLAGIAAGILYTGGPYPYGYHGLGDLFVFVFFGLIAVTGTYYVQAVVAAGVGLFPAWIPPDTVPLEVVVASLPVAGIVTDVLVVNNVRDRESDAEAGKRTLAVILGYRWSRVQYVALLGLAYAVPVWFLLQPAFGIEVLLPLLTLPYAATVTRTVLTETSGEALNPALERTGKLLVAFAALFGAGLAL